MPYFNNIMTKNSNKISTFLVILIVFLTTQSTHAQEKMSKMDILIGLHYGLSTIIPIIGAVILLLLLIVYAFRLVSRDTFFRWAFSIIIASAAFYISNVLFYIT